jgi:hypothetical protein
VEAREMPEHRAPRAHARRPRAVGVEQRRRLPVEEIEHAPRRHPRPRRPVGRIVAGVRKAGGQGLTVGPVGALDEGGRKRAEQGPHERVVERGAQARVLEVEEAPAARRARRVARCHVAVGQRGPRPRPLHELDECLDGLVDRLGRRLAQGAEPRHEILAPSAERAGRGGHGGQGAPRELVTPTVELRGEGAHRHMEPRGEPSDLEQRRLGALARVPALRVQQVLERRRLAQIFDDEASRFGVPAEKDGRRRRREPRRGKERQRRPLVQAALRLGLVALDDDRRGQARAARDPRPPDVVPRPRLQELGDSSRTARPARADSRAAAVSSGAITA